MRSTVEYQLSERFEVAFNQVHEVLKSIVKIKDDRFVVLLDIGAKKHQMIANYYNDLKQYAKLRNSIVHDKKELGYYIAEPHKEVVEHIEMIAKVFSKPNYALSIASKRVVCFEHENNLEEVLTVIKENGYSQYPVYKNKECIGLLSTHDILQWMLENHFHTVVNITDTLVSDIISTVKDHPIEFVSKTMDIFTVEDIYEEKHKNKTDLEAIIITENGSKNERPLGLITAWDLIQLDYQDEVGY